MIDEYGGVAGIVTVEDISKRSSARSRTKTPRQEEIIEIIEGEDGYFDVLGSTDIDKIERLFDIDIEDDDFTTIAGLVTSEAGYVPKVGEKLTCAASISRCLRPTKRSWSCCGCVRHRGCRTKPTCRKRQAL